MSTKFRSVLKASSQGDFLKPLLLNMLASEDWGTFDIHLKAQERNRKPDGWFHPSEHPLMPERQLYYYLTSDAYQRAPMSAAGMISVTVGTMMHSLVEHLVTMLGLRLTKAEMDSAGFFYGEDGEPAFKDGVTGARGHTDGILHTLGQLCDGPYANFEFKTCRSTMLATEAFTLDWFRGKWPGYYAQQQEYLRMSKLPGSLVLFMSNSSPWEMAEVWVPSDPFFQDDVAQKYLRVRRAVAEDYLPAPCCNAGSPESRACPARLVCPRGTV